MRIGIATFALLIGSFASAQVAPAPEVKDAYEMCQAAVIEGYGSRGREQFCQESFDLPDPFLLKCIRWIRTGFSEELDKRACQYFCESSKNWGPWFDYEIRFEDKLIFAEMSRRHHQQRCHEP